MAKILGSHIPTEIRNLAINGALDFWQRVESNTTTINTATTSSGYTADMIFYTSQGSTVKNYSIVRSTDVPTQAQSGFVGTYSYLFTMVTGIASPAASDVVIPFEYRMEGFDYEKIHSKNVTFGFWVKASVAGTYSFALGNGAGNRSYVTTFTVSGASTWQYVTINITLDNTGTWAFDNTLGLVAYVGAFGGSTDATGVLNSWQSGLFAYASTGTNWQATSGATLQITQFSLVEGPLGFSSTGFARQGRSLQQEFALCQRYYEKSFPLGNAPGATGFAGASQYFSNSTADRDTRVYFKVSKRTGTPTVAIYSPQTGAGGTGASMRINNRSTTSDQTPGIGDGVSDMSFNMSWTMTTAQHYAFHWTIEAGL